MRQFCEFCYFLQNNYGNIELNLRVFSLKVMYYEVLTLSKIILNRFVRKKIDIILILDYIILIWAGKSLVLVK